ncbi:MAG TPA: L-2-hydroxyglutarate oxidase [Terriglobales bacterium]|nr:L-2-hydroxyglutarate oxidase [Terriglobales bacterium]
MPENSYDVVIVGAGVVGLSVALEITLRLPRLRLAVLEKESGIARHQSGHNSGVIHSGVYYKPGSLKARLCVQGAAEMIEFCRVNNVPHKICGKLIVATTPEELPRLNDLQQRGQSNGVAGLKLLGPEEMRETEPHCHGVRALLVPGTGITDYTMVCQKYAGRAAAQGASINTDIRVMGFRRDRANTMIETTRGTFVAGYVINCAGLHSDRVARMAGYDPDVRIVPFRGEYYDLAPQREGLVRSLIYPVPDPRFPFLGVHFTTRVHGGVDAGPNAVLAFKREGYRHRDLSPKDLLSTFTYPGFWRMAGKYWRSGLAEFYRSLSKHAFVTALQKLVPEVNDSDLLPGGSGVRAQAVARDGSLLDDFHFVQAEKMLHVLNVPSPAATSSLPIGRAIVDMAEKGGLGAS